jgi:hypothetical protein
MKLKRKFKDRSGDLILILLFLAVIAGCAYAIMKMMMRWKIKGLGY